MDKLLAVPNFPPQHHCSPILIDSPLDVGILSDSFFNQDKHTFTIGENPDVSSIPAHFTLEVYTVSNAGEVNKATIEVQINSAIHAPAEYTLIEHDVNTSYENNYFGIDLAIMKTALGDNLNQWIQNVDLHDAAVTMEWSYDGGKTFGAIPAGIQANVVSELLNKSS